MSLVKDVSILNKIFVLGFPENVYGNEKRVNKDLLCKLNKKYNNYDKIFLWLSRLNYLNKNSGSYKGVEKFLESFEELLNEYNPNVLLVCGDHSQDADEFKKLIRKKQLEKYVEFVPHLPYWKLLTYLSIDNAILFDTIRKNSSSNLGGITREGICLGKIVVKSFDQSLCEVSYGSSPPIFSITDKKSCKNAMIKILNMNDDQIQLHQEKIKKWANDYLHFENNLHLFLRKVMEIKLKHDYYRNKEK